jgi:hypothetical protein
MARLLGTVIRRSWIRLRTRPDGSATATADFVEGLGVGVAADAADPKATKPRKRPMRADPTLRRTIPVCQIEANQGFVGPNH